MARPAARSESGERFVAGAVRAESTGNHSVPERAPVLSGVLIAVRIERCSVSHLGDADLVREFDAREFDRRATHWIALGGHAGGAAMDHQRDRGYIPDLGVVIQ